MFKGTKYVTKGVQSKIPAELQSFMCMCVLALPKPADYLQIFRLYYSAGKQKIIHEQEQTEYKRKHILNFPNPVTAKVYVIDDGDHCTMLLAEEY